MVSVNQVGYICALLALTAHGEPAVQGFYVDQALQVSHNPLGAQSITKLFYRLPVFEEEGVLWESTKLDVGFQNNLSPAYDLAGFFVRFEPIAVFDIALTAQFAGYYNLLGYGFLDLPSREASTDPNETYLPATRNAFGFVGSVAPTLKFAWKPFAATNTFTLTYFYADDGEGFYFERIGNVGLAKSDIELSNSAYLLAEPYPDFYVGVNDWILLVPNSGHLSHRLAGVAAYTARLSEFFSVYMGLFLGTFVSDRYHKYAFYTAAQFGISTRL